MCDHKNIIWVEVAWDYDWVLYEGCKDCWYKKNRFTWIEFDEHKNKETYSPMFQFSKWKLVWYSRYKAEGLNIDDDIHKWENLLWGGRGINWKEQPTFRPIKDLSIPHIRKIIEEWHTRDKNYLSAFNDRLTSVITINEPTTKL